MHQNVCHPLQIIWDYTDIKAQLQMAKTLAGLQKRWEFLLRRCQKLLKISHNRPIPKKIPKKVKSCPKLFTISMPSAYSPTCLLYNLVENSIKMTNSKANRAILSILV